MPNYNGNRFVEQAIGSVLRQTYPNIELLIVDDCSSDGSLRLIREIAQRDERIRVIELAQNGGVANARNAGIREARGEYVALIDNDDVWTEDKLERQLALAQRGADIVYSSYDFIDENGNAVNKPYLVPEKTDFDRMLTENVIGCSTALVKTELLRSHPFRAEFYHEDYVLWMELLQSGASALGDTEVAMHYRLVPGSRSNKKGNAAKERWKIYRGALKLNVFKSAYCFIRYAVNGIKKYFA